MGKSLEQVKTSLEVDEHVDAHRKGFVIQKVGILVILGIVLAAALGIFGDDLISNKTISLPLGSVSFQRFHRHEANMKLTVSVSRNDRNQIKVSFPANYLKSLEIRTITPDATTVDLRGDRVDYTFAGNGKNVIINFSVVPHEMGSVKGLIEVNDSPVEIMHFIYP